MKAQNPVVWFEIYVDDMARAQKPGVIAQPPTKRPITALPRGSALGIHCMR